MPQASKADLHQAMQGATTTDGWDVLVSYSADKLNEFLKAKWNSQAHLRKFEIDVVTDNVLHQFTTKFDLNVKDPQLSFDAVTGNGNALLKIPIVDSETPDPNDPKKKIPSQCWDKNKPDKKLPIPGNKFYIEGRFPLAAINPKDGNFEEKTTIIKFNLGDQESKYHIVFHFQNLGATWAVRGNTSADESGNAWDVLTSTGDGLKKYFAGLKQEQHIDISLGEVTNDRGASNLMTPKSFMIGSQPGVLNVFIQTMGSGKGPGSVDRLFKIPGDKDYAPIPTGQEASIIISRDVIQKFLTTEITKKIGTSSLQDENGVQASGDKSGMNIKVVYNKNILMSLPPEKIVSFGAPITWVYYEDNVISFKDHPMILSISDDPTTFKPMYKWSWNATGVLHTKVVISGKVYQELHKTWDYTFKTDGSKRELTTLANDKIGFSMEFAEGDKPKNDELKVEDQTVHINTKLETFKVTLPELDYFRSSNIFAPGNHMIDANDIMFPGDMVVMGKIAKPA